MGCIGSANSALKNNGASLAMVRFVGKDGAAYFQEEEESCPVLGVVEESRLVQEAVESHLLQAGEAGSQQEGAASEAPVGVNQAALQA